MMRSLDGLAWTARWMVRFRGMTEETGILRGEPGKRTGWGKDSRVVSPRGEKPGTSRRRVPETRRLGIPGAGWDTYSD